MKNIKLVSKEAAGKTERTQHISYLQRIAARRSPSLRAAAIMSLLAAAAVASAVTNAPPDPGAVPDINTFQALFDGLTGKYGWLTTVVLIIGSLRILFKPIMLAIENYVRQTPGTADDARLAEFEASLTYKLIVLLLDFCASIKLPSNAPRTQTGSKNSNENDGLK